MLIITFQFKYLCASGNKSLDKENGLFDDV